MKSITYLSAVWFVGICAWGVVAQNQDSVEIKIAHLSGPVHMLEGEGGNIGISAGSDGVLMIDDQFERLAAKIKAAIETLGHGQPKIVLNTHYHGDHTGGNVAFGREAFIVAHENVRKRLEADKPEEALPDITYAKSISIYFNGERIKIFHMPTGHTDGDSVVYFVDSNVLHMGDQFFHGRFPYVDLGGGGTVQGYMKNVGMILEHVNDETKIIPGHGPLATKSDLAAFAAMLEETSGIVRKQMEAGKSLDAIKQSGLPSKYAELSWRFISTERWIETIYNSYGAKE